MRRLLPLALLAALAAPATLAAQAVTDEAGAKAVGQKMVTWFFDTQVDSIYELMTPEFRDQIGGKDAIGQAMMQIITNQGIETEVVSEEVKAGDAPGTWIYTRVGKLDGSSEPRMRWEIAVNAEGRVPGARMGPDGG